jgi:phosphoesterase RecJ-like protein
MKTPRAVLTSLKREPEILIAGHSAPDGDALGSALALAEALDDLGKRTYVYNSDPVPAYYRFLPGYRRCRRSLRAVLAGDPLLVLLD